jgi:hypothetical protein
MNIPIEDIRKEIPPEKYGLRKYLLEDLCLTSFDEIFIKKSTKSLSNGYDCFDASIKVKEILQKYRIKSDLYSGLDEKGLWNAHIFVVTDDGVKVDGTPIYKTIGADHIVLNKLSREEIKRQQIKILQPSVYGDYVCVPSRYQKLDETKKLLSRVGVNRIPDRDKIFLRNYRLEVPPTEVILELILLDDEKPTDAYKIIASFDENSLYRELSNSGFMPSDMAMDKITEKFKQLVVDKKVKLTGKHYSLKFNGPRKLRVKETFVDEIDSSLTEEIEKDMVVLSSLVEKVPFALYA